MWRYGVDVVPNLQKTVPGTGIDVAPIPVPTPGPTPGPTPVQTSVPVLRVPVLMSYRNYPSVRYRYRYRTELTEASGTGIDAVPNIPKCPVPALMSYRRYRSVRNRYESLYRYRWYRYSYRTEFIKVSGICIGETKLTNCPVPVFLSYRTYRTIRYRKYRRYASVRTVPKTPLKY